MSSNDAVGRCPECRSRIHRPQVLIEYQRDDEWTRYAECPDCGRVVRPTDPGGTDCPTEGQ